MKALPHYSHPLAWRIEPRWETTDVKFYPILYNPETSSQIPVEVFSAMTPWRIWISTFRRTLLPPSSGWCEWRWEKGAQERWRQSKVPSRKREGAVWRPVGMQVASFSATLVSYPTRRHNSKNLTRKFVSAKSS